MCDHFLIVRPLFLHCRSKATDPLSCRGRQCCSESDHLCFVNIDIPKELRKLDFVAYKDVSHKVNLIASNEPVTITSKNFKFDLQLERCMSFISRRGENVHVLVFDRSVQNPDCELQTEYKMRFVFVVVVVVEEM